MNSFYSYEELRTLGLKSFGKNVLISRNCQIYNANEIQIGNDVRIDDFCILSGAIILHDHIHISAYTALYGKGGIEIHDYCGCSPKSIIFSASDDFSGKHMISPMVSEKYTKVMIKKVILNKFVQLGANSTVMPGVEIGEGVATSAYSFVNKRLDPWHIYGGIPCRKLKIREKNILELSKKYEEEK